MPSLHERPWVPMQSTNAPQLQVCSAQRGVPSRKPIATRTASSSRPYALRLVDIYISVMLDAEADADVGADESVMLVADGAFVSGVTTMTSVS